MAAPPRGTFSSRAARDILLGAFSADHRVAMAAPPRVRFAALYLLLGALWLANANTITKTFQRCAGLECFHSDDECRISLEFTGIALISLLLLRVDWRRFSEACEADVGAQDDLPPEGPAVEPGRPYPPVGKMGHRNDLDLDVHFLVCYSTSYVVFGILGMTYQLASPVMGSPAAVFGNIMAKAGCLTTAYASCLLVIPCIVLRLRMFHREIDEGATAA